MSIYREVMREEAHQSSERRAAPHVGLRQFMAAWKAEFGDDLSESEAHLRLHELVELYLLVAKPVSDETGNQLGD